MKLSGRSLAKVDRHSQLYLALAAAHLRIAEKDSKTWGTKAAPEAAMRLNWIDLPISSRALLPDLNQIRARFSSLSTFVLCGMGGSSLGPEVIARTYGKEIFILDSTDPQYLAKAFATDLSRTLVIVSSKSGSTIEVASQRTLFEAKFTSASLDPREHMIFVTDPGSPLDTDVRSLGYQVISADPHVGGRFSVLSAFGLVPSALIGVPVSELLSDAQIEQESFLAEPQAVLDVAYLFATQSDQYLAFTDAQSNFPGLSDWIEQLIAESTGKDATGRLPIVTENALDASVGGALTVSYAGEETDLIVAGPLAAHFIFWEWVTALLSVALKIDPFNQPNVTEAKEQTAACLTEWQNRLPEF